MLIESSGLTAPSGFDNLGVPSKVKPQRQQEPERYTTQALFSGSIQGCYMVPRTLQNGDEIQETENYTSTYEQKHNTDTRQTKLQTWDEKRGVHEKQKRDVRWP